ncbi:MAG TPA: hypothetical protein VHQ94_16235 [Pyrinomonadaceae bacterium]|jgi:hypothetical protein|nr:hypothetical protein [Pyrinomonadaceae bacterium]
MSRVVITSLIFSLLVIVLPQDEDLNRLQTTYDPQKKENTIRVPSTKLAGPNDRYESLTFSVYYSTLSMFPSPPQTVNFEIVSVVKARKLNPDLYVVFVVDGKEIHFGSNRSAIPKPAPGKPWIGERMVFLIPYEEFKKIAAAKTLAVKLGGVSFDFDDEMQRSIRAIARHMALTVTH